MKKKEGLYSEQVPIAVNSVEVNRFTKFLRGSSLGFLWCSLL